MLDPLVFVCHPVLMLGTESRFSVREIVGFFLIYLFLFVYPFLQFRLHSPPGLPLTAPHPMLSSLIPHCQEDVITPHPHPTKPPYSLGPL